MGITETNKNEYLLSFPRMGTTRSCLMLTLFPGGGFGMFTDGDQQSTFWGFKFEKSVFIWVLVTAAVFFWL